MARIRAVQGGAGRVRTGVRGSSGAAAVPPVPAAGLVATPSFNFTIENGQRSSAQNGFVLPGTLENANHAVATPATASNGWFFSMMFHIPEMFNFLSNNEHLGQKGTALVASGGSDAAVWINQANVATPTALRANIKKAGVSFFGGALGPYTLVRGTSYLIVIGQISTNWFLAIVDTAGNIIQKVSGAVGTAINTYSVFAGVGCGVGLASGDASGFSGRISNVSMVWGNFPNAGGASTVDSTTLQNLATGITDIKTVCTSISGTYRYFNSMDPTASVTSLAADATATITGAMTQVTTWTPVTAGLVGDPVRPQPWLTLQPEGEHYVWGITPGSSTGDVWFRGTYALASGSAPTLEAKLIRKDNGATLVDWTALSSATVAAGAYSGKLAGVPAGVGFNRLIRYTGQNATALTCGEKHGVGIVILGNAQSQLAMMANVGTNGNGASQGNITPTDTSNVFASVMRAPNGWSDTVPTAPNQSYGPNNDVFGVRPILATSNSSTVTSSGTVGDPILLLIDKVQTRSSLPVMYVDVAHSGIGPYDFWSDRQTVNITGGAGNGWSPNGSTTAFTIALGAPSTVTTPFLNGKTNPLGGTYGTTLPYQAGTAGISSPMVVKGSFQIVVGGVTITDDGAGNLAGTGVTGTINYNATSSTYPSCTLTFGAAPAGGTALTAAWTKIADYGAGTNSAKATPNGFSTAGIIGTAHTGQVSDAIARLWNNTVTTVVHPWWTTLVPLTGYLGRGSSQTYATTMTNLYMQLDAIKYFWKQFAACANAKFFFAPAARECPTSGSSELAQSYGGHRFATYAYVRDNPSDCALLADMNDASIASNNGPHEDWYGYQAMGQRYGTSIAAGLGYGGANLYSGIDNSSKGIPNAPVMGPVLTGVTRKNSTTLTLTFALPNGTSLSSYGGVTTVGTTIVGFEVGTSNTSAALAYTGRAIASGTIQSATTIDVTTPTQLTFVSLSYAAGYNVFTGIANYTADTANLKNLLCDNAGGYTLPTAGNGAGPAAGNGAQSVLDWAA